MRTRPALAAALVLAAAAGATAQDTAYPTNVGDGVDPHNLAHWPVRIRTLERVRWTYRGGSHPGMATPSPDGFVRLVAGAGHIRGLEAATGKHRWISHGNPRWYNYSSCALGPDGVAYGGNREWIRAVDARGERLWTAKLRASWIHRPPVLSPDGRTVYFCSDNVGLASVDAASGAINWLKRDFKSPWASLCFDGKGRILVATGTSVTCFDGQGGAVWSLDERMKQLMVTEELLLGVHEDTLKAFDLRTLNERWAHRSPARVRGIALGDDGRIRVALADGSLACVDLRGGDTIPR